MASSTKIQESKALFVGAVVWIGSIATLISVVLLLVIKIDSKQSMDTLSVITPKTNKNNTENLNKPEEKPVKIEKIKVNKILPKKNDTIESPLKKPIQKLSNETNKELSKEQKKPVIKKKIQTITIKEDNQSKPTPPVASDIIWIVQVASYSREDYAKKLADLLKKNKHEVRLFTQEKGEILLHVVQLKRTFPNRTQAQRMAKKIEMQFNLVPFIFNTYKK